MPTFASVLSALYTLVFSLLIDRRAQAAAALALALMAGLLLGPDGVEARRNPIAGGPRP